jgi:hypothetical protein
MTKDKQSSVTHPCHTLRERIEELNYPDGDAAVWCENNDINLFKFALAWEGDNAALLEIADKLEAAKVGCKEFWVNRVKRYEEYINAPHE